MPEMRVMPRAPRAMMLPTIMPVTRYWRASMIPYTNKRPMRSQRPTVPAFSTWTAYSRRVRPISPAVRVRERTMLSSATQVELADLFVVQQAFAGALQAVLAHRQDVPTMGKGEGVTGGLLYHHHRHARDVFLLTL